MKKAISLFMLILVSGNMNSQTIFPASVLASHGRPSQLKAPNTIGGLAGVVMPQYPLVRISGVGGASGSLDSSLSKSAKAFAFFLPDEHLTIYTGFNLGRKADSISGGTEPQTDILLFPDANQYGFVGGIGYKWNILNWPTPTISNKIMQLNAEPNMEYSFQGRDFIKKDTTGIFHSAFKTHTWMFGWKVSLNYFVDKFNIGMDITPGLYLLDISNNTNNEFKSVYAITNAKLENKLPSTYGGGYLQIALRLNKVSFFYKYAELRSFKSNMNVQGITHGQHFIGLSLTADIAEIE